MKQVPSSTAPISVAQRSVRARPDLIERRRELGVAVLDEEPELADPV